jgi:hypothetical protein
MELSHVLLSAILGLLKEISTWSTLEAAEEGSKEQEAIGGKHVGRKIGWLTS